MSRVITKSVAAAALCVTLSACGSFFSDAQSRHEAPTLPPGTPNPIALAKLDGLWTGTGKADGLTVRIARAGSSTPRALYGFRGEQPIEPQCSAADATLNCTLPAGLTTTYTANADGSVDFTAKGPNPGDELIAAKLQRTQ